MAKVDTYARNTKKYSKFIVLFDMWYVHVLYGIVLYDYSTYCIFKNH